MIKKHIGTITDEIAGIDDIPVIVFCEKLNVKPDNCEFIIHGGVTDVYQLIED